MVCRPGAGLWSRNCSDDGQMDPLVWCVHPARPPRCTIDRGGCATRVIGRGDAFRAFIGLLGHDRSSGRLALGVVDGRDGMECVGHATPPDGVRNLADRGGHSTCLLSVGARGHTGMDAVGGDGVGTPEDLYRGWGCLESDGRSGGVGGSHGRSVHRHLVTDARTLGWVWRVTMGLGLTHLSRIPARLALGFRMDLAFVLRSPALTIYYLAIDALLIPAVGGATFLLAERLAGIGPWSDWQVLFLLGYATTVEGILSAAFTYNVSHISRRIGRGQFDHLLVQPQPLWLTLATEGFAPISGGAALVTGIAIMSWAWTGLGLPLTLAWTGAFAVNLLSSVCVVLATMFLWSVVAFWAPVAGEEISMNVHDALGSLGTFPLDGIGGAMGIGLVTVFPAGLVAWMPVRALVGVSADPWGFLLTPAAAVLMFVIAVPTFARGLRRYRQTGSSRYSTFGHRR